ncbi:MAG: transposase [Proteobacteria bacterium]|nr:transposase [Pseudomonadota bacterium]
MTSNSLIGFEVVRQLGFKHQVVQALKGKAGTEIDAFKWLNVMLENLKTAQSGTYHAFKYSKYADCYLAEMQYRLNRRLICAPLSLIAKHWLHGCLAEQETCQVANSQTLPIYQLYKTTIRYAINFNKGDLYDEKQYLK